MTETQLRSETSTCRRISKEKEDEARQAQAELTRERVVRERAIEEAKEDAERKLRLQQAEMDKLKQQIQRLQQQRQGFPDDNSEGLSVSGIVGRSSTSSPMLSAPPMPKSAIAQGAGSNFDSITSPTSQDGFAPMMLRSSSAQTMSGAGVSSSVGLMNFGGNASGQAVAIERLNTMVRQLEGQVTFLNEQVRTANKNKDELSDELVRVTMELEEMQSHASRASGIDQELSLLQQRHKAALEMLGEKTEEVQELRADLHDVKEAYRDQINDLLGQLESLRRVNA
ncbi:TATA element modulatory factor 1 TATA binding-domain-containing protein [Mortierella sp. GBAus27b]|nr:TATA element modulatory factor 1 TATA binding-domain-containing protein [Mortierella sp. GBAus27b]